MFCTYLCFSLLCRKAINYINHVMLNYRKYSEQFNFPHRIRTSIIPQNTYEITKCTQH